MMYNDSIRGWGVMSRSTRQAKIISIITSMDIETQEELVEQLRVSNFVVTQATISRDIKELNLVKTLTTSGKYKYTALNEASGVVPNKMLGVFKEIVVSVSSVAHQVVVKTMPNCGITVAAIVDQLKLADVLGIVNDTETVLVICMDNAQAVELKDKLNSILI